MVPREPCQGRTLGSQGRKKRLCRGNFRTDNLHLRLPQLLCLETSLCPWKWHFQEIIPQD